MASPYQNSDRSPPSPPGGPQDNSRASESFPFPPARRSWRVCTPAAHATEQRPFGARPVRAPGRRTVPWTPRPVQARPIRAASTPARLGAALHFKRLQRFRANVGLDQPVRAVTSRISHGSASCSSRAATLTESPAAKTRPLSASDEDVAGVGADQWRTRFRSTAPTDR